LYNNLNYTKMREQKLMMCPVDEPPPPPPPPKPEKPKKPEDEEE
jgi:hypothetical protein